MRGRRQQQRCCLAMVCVLVVVAAQGLEAAAFGIAKQPEDVKVVVLKTSRSGSTLLSSKLGSLPFACVMDHEVAYNAGLVMNDINVGQLSS